MSSGLFLFKFLFFNQVSPITQNHLATIQLPRAGPMTSLKFVYDRLYERRPSADFRLVAGLGIE
jgi:hypothetical protein